MLRKIPLSIVALATTLLISCARDYEYQDSVYLQTSGVDLERILVFVKSISNLEGTSSEVEDPVSHSYSKAAELHAAEQLFYIAQASKDTCDNKPGEYGGQYFVNTFVVNISATTQEKKTELIHILRKLAESEDIVLYRNRQDICMNPDRLF